jgi:hypothetical protein
MRDFKNPEKIYRPAPFWSWNEKLCSEELTRQIDEMNDKGWGGYFMHSRVGLVTEYLSDEWMELIKACTEKARETETSAWLYDEDKWPSGFAGGIVPEKEEFRNKALLMLKEDEITENDTPVIKVNKNNTEYTVCTRISPLGNEWFNGMCYVDLMNPKAVDYFLHVTLDKYKEHCSESFGKEIPGVFTDEPCYLMANHYKGIDFILPWSDYLPDFFQELKGYSILDNIEKLFIDKGDFRKIRYDFFESSTKLFLESFTKKYYKWCNDNNLKLTGHFMAEDTMQSQSLFIGAAMPHYEFMHWPGIDKLGRHIEQTVTTKQLSSVADQLGKERSFSEIYGCVGQHVSFFHRKWIGDWQAALGINFFNYHLSHYSLRGERKRDYPANLFYQQPWWDEERNFSEYMTRLSYMLSQGERKLDICVLHPIGSTWSEFDSLNEENNNHGKSKYDDAFKNLTDRLIGEKLDFHYGDEFILEEHGCIKNNALSIGKGEYHTFIIPESITIRKSTLKILRDFMKDESAMLYIIKPGPTLIEGEEKDINWPERTCFVNNINELIDNLNRRYTERISVNDSKTGKNIDKIIIHERSIGDDDIVFITNSDEENAYDAIISIKTDKKIIIKDMYSGENYSIRIKNEGDIKKINVQFEKAGSILLSLSDKEEITNICPAVLESGVIFKKEYITVKKPVIDEAKTFEENVLPINKAKLILDGKKVLDNDYIAKTWHKHFYKAKNNTPFQAEYIFNIKEIPEGDLTVAVEMAENLESIMINGKNAKVLREKGEKLILDNNKCWKDISFTKVDITGLVKEGENCIILKGRKVNNIKQVYIIVLQKL